MSVKRAIPDLARGAALMADAIATERKLAYAAAGSSGLMAMADGLELPGTFSIENDRIKILMAGGTSSLTDMLGGTEDDLEAARQDVLAAGIGEGDCMIAVSASGSTPYTVAAANAAAEAGAKIIGIANNPNTPTPPAPRKAARRVNVTTDLPSLLMLFCRLHPGPA